MMLCHVDPPAVPPPDPSSSLLYTQTIMALTAAQKEVIKASIPFLEQHGVELTATFYQYMLDNHPEVRPFFNKSHQATKTQPKILAFALLNYAKNIDDLTPLLGFVRQIVEKHVGLQVYPEQYDVVGICLLHTLAEMLGDAATPDFIEAWKVAYYDLANILIQLEKDRYAEVIRTEHAWAGFKPARVVKLVQETEFIKSVHIETVDGHYATPFPGQYVCIRLSTDGGESIQSREYSLSNELEDEYDHYRISVKSVEGGVVSNYIHNSLKVGDEIEIGAPYGKLLEPTLKSIKDSGTYHDQPVVFFIGGIGVTPSLSLLEYFLKRNNKVHLMLSYSDLESAPFVDSFQKIYQEYSALLDLHEFITHLPESYESKVSVQQRRIEVEDLSFITNDNANNFQYFMVGPIGYMDSLKAMLGKKGVDLSKINSEEFGPVHV